MRKRHSGSGAAGGGLPLILWGGLDHRPGWSAFLSSERGACRLTA